jgi:tripartite-type tricarboxylate transporter receptor subunit TctC
MLKKGLTLVAGAVLATLVPSTAVWAQADTYPDRPIHFVAPYNPGGTVDPTARIIAQTSCAIRATRL